MTARRTFTFLGTGTSVGVPVLGCGCAVCTSDDPKNHRYRCSALVSAPGGRLLIDTAPELRLQLLRARVPHVDAVLYTHFHADHLFGLDDVRIFPFATGKPVPLYCTAEVEAVVRRAYWYAFESGEGLHPGALPQLEFHRVNGEPFEVAGERVVPVPLVHGRFRCTGFRIDGLAYCTDASSIPDGSWGLLEGLDVLVLDCLRPRPHPAHLSLGEALAVAERLRPRRTYLTHMGHELDYEAVSRELPPHVRMAYDGLSFPF